MPRSKPRSGPTSPEPWRNTAAHEVRAFSRFYTRLLGLLDEHLLASDRSLTEARVLYELAHRTQPEQLTAAALARDLGLDPAYLSRLLRRFAQRGLLARQALAGDARSRQLSLTAAGRAAQRPLERAAQQQVLELIAPLDAAQAGELTGAMRRIEQLLAASAPARAAGATQARAEPLVLRGLEIGDIGWIARRQGQLYAQEHGWDRSFEALVAEIAARFVREFDPRYERAWVAERGGRILGSVFCVKASRRRGREEAKLRLLYVEPEARGLGLGARLVDECIRFARDTGCRRLTLWTNDVLVAARRIYQARGFRLVREERHRSFGRDLVGQYWALDLV